MKTVAIKQKWVIAMSFDKTKYQNEYQKETYDRVSVFVPKGKRNELKRFASQKGLSVNRLIVEAIESYYGIDLS